VLGKARAEIHKSWREACELNRDHPDAETLFNPEKLPGFHDPFAGGGALPLEAQRLGLESHASDLNPVAVLINKAMIEIPPKFAGHAPVNPDTRAKTALLERTWKHAQGLAEDVRYYGKWMRDEAQNRIGYVYPAVEVTADMASERPDLRPLIGQRLTVVAWLWARTVKSPNPAFRHVDVPLASSFILSIKKGKEAYVQPVLEGDHYHFTVKMGRPPDEATNGTKSGGSGSTFTCLLSQAPMDFAYIRGEAKRGRMGQKLLAIVTESQGGRVYLSPTKEAEAVALGATPAWAPSTPLPAKALGFRVQEYGMAKWADLFTSRQLVALTTFSDLLIEARQKIQTEALAAGRRKGPQRRRRWREGIRRGDHGVPGMRLEPPRQLQQHDLSLEPQRWQRCPDLCSSSRPHVLGLHRSGSIAEDERELDWWSRMGERCIRQS
jgi:putative DNA methylase